MKKTAILELLLTALLFASATAHAAPITLAGLTFNENAFADLVVEVKGTWITNVGDLAGAVLGSDITTWAVNLPYDETAYIKVAFTDNSIVNGAGADLVVFEATGSNPGCPARITIADVTRTYATPWREGLVNAAIINLDDFGIAPGGLVSVVTLWGGSNDTDYMGIGALNSTSPVPVPGAVLLGTLGAGAVGWLRRRKTL